MSKKTIMLVDDASTLRKYGRRILEDAGYNVVPVENGFNALSTLFEHKIDLILLDVLMPRLDGYETFTMIKDNENFKDIPIIMVTGKDSPFDKVKGELLGCKEYVTKPYDEVALLQKVGQYLSENS